MASPSAPYWLLPFDRDADYVFGAWPKGFTVNGKHPKIGELVDKTQFSTRMLKEHYERRWIRRLEEADRKYLKIEDRPFGAPPDDLPTVKMPLGAKDNLPSARLSAMRITERPLSEPTVLNFSPSSRNKIERRGDPVVETKRKRGRAAKSVKV